MTPIAPCLWFNNQAEEAARYYTELFPDSRIDRIVRAPVNNPGAEKGAVSVVEFTLNGQPYLALNGGMDNPFTEAVSFTIATETQEETDQIWDRIIAEGGAAIQCGWCRDRFGLRWQIYPRRMLDLLSHEDRELAARAMQAMMTMVKIEIADVEKAASGG
ncbi:VOC family protein [Hyphobacterium sp.]|uniref:VOC family protein n=1 Tax=Hyphobacterium sp. TaxID=2004662 RepID=UPI003BABF42C